MSAHDASLRHDDRRDDREWRALLVDERFVVVRKPTSLLSVPGIGPEKADCLVGRVQRAFAGARIVHRLDRDTSGVIVLARDADAHRELSRQFQDRETGKTYHALVGGHPAQDAGTIDLPMRKDLDRPPLQIVDHERGRSARTDWRVVARGVFGDELPASLVELAPHTGRSHQLRVHMLELGHPILGDDLYAPESLRGAVPRLMLHATRLWFVHPGTAAPVDVADPPPFGVDDALAPATGPAP